MTPLRKAFSRFTLQETLTLWASLVQGESEGKLVFLAQAHTFPWGKVAPPLGGDG